MNREGRNQSPNLFVQVKHAKSCSNPPYITTNEGNILAYSRETLWWLWIQSRENLDHCVRGNHIAVCLLLLFFCCCFFWGQEFATGCNAYLVSLGCTWPETRCHLFRWSNLSETWGAWYSRWTSADLVMCCHRKDHSAKGMPRNHHRIPANVLYQSWGTVFNSNIHIPVYRLTGYRTFIPLLKFTVPDLFPICLCNIFLLFTLFLTLTLSL